MTVAVATLIVSAAVAAAQPGPGRGSRGESRWTRLAEALDLTEDQKQAIGAIRDEARTQQLQTRKQIVQLEAQLRTVMLADTPDEAAALKLVAQIGDLRAEQQANRVKVRLAIRKQLTPEQQTQFILREGRGNRGPRGGGEGRGRDGDCGRPGPGAPGAGRGRI
jgi:Spy/CpxP family protein refolding chaperone